jgi:hypothetical protein
VADAMAESYKFEFYLKKEANTTVFGPFLLVFFIAHNI